MWFVNMGGGISGKCMLCMGDRVEIEFVVAHDKANGQWERQGLMRHDELRNKHK